MNLKKITLLGISLFLLSQGALLINAEESTDESAVEQTSEVVEESSQTETTENTEVSELQALVEEAVAKFQETYPDADIDSIDIELNRDDKYEIEISGFTADKEYEMDFLGAPLEVTHEEEDNDRADKDDVALVLEDLLTLDEAVEAAKAEVSETAKAVKWHLDHDDDAPEDVFEWEIHFVEEGSDDETEVHVDAKTGDILEVELDD